jgi:hypothetical protein
MGCKIQFFQYVQLIYCQWGTTEETYAVWSQDTVTDVQFEQAKVNFWSFYLRQIRQHGVIVKSSYVVVRYL